MARYLSSQRRSRENKIRRGEEETSDCRLLAGTRRFQDPSNLLPKMASVQQRMAGPRFPFLEKLGGKHGRKHELSLDQAA